MPADIVERPQRLLSDTQPPGTRNVTIQDDNDIRGLQRVGGVVARVLEQMLSVMEPGMTTAELDALGEALLEKHGARPAPRLAYDFPGATCISINEEAAHGVPSGRVIRAGDVVNVDVSAELGGYFADTGGTRVVPPGSQQKTQLLNATRAALRKAMGAARAGRPLNHIGRAIERVARAHRFHILRNLCSHGTGRALHEAPEQIPGYWEPAETRRLAAGMVITIEPFLSTRSTRVTEASDGWTLGTAPGNLSAQFEHTMIITTGTPIVVTRV